ncbi:two-component system histidine kinase PnpS [Clostridium folliculivorans]|uniref:histidine kinase n=1 Tax=Clostridium folliculivorans TaxID=2886038 RepID=A0A9W5Y2A3_9CLOT|nr:sensor histidine kinase [Clostridium folliculivorans]GKU25286.1 PAS domain-containing sensor histidine kinase [Clostridium folliculivorans]GKU28307.1 PAS domain-containing sensor histidine kinase [Clostridium folliculivorans]
MKKKIMFSVIITIIFSLVVVTSSFIAISNYQYLENSKANLKHYNDLLSTLILANEPDKIVKLNQVKALDREIRFTYISKTGVVEFDTDKRLEDLDNHLTRVEIAQAIKSGEGSSVRFSKSLNKNLVYYATKLQDGSIVRTSIPLDNVKIFQDTNIKYYLITLVFVIVLSVVLSLKLTRFIVDPVKELEIITARIARGELDGRVRVSSVDELGSLGMTFNEMADKLEVTMDELIDKQNRLEAILKSMDSGVIAVDRSHKIIMINPYAEKIFGIDKDIIGETLMDHIRDFELDNVFETSDAYKEIKIIWPEERELRIRTAEIINDREHIGTVAVVQDITDIKKLENMRSQFVANVSHELKTPLTSIKGFAETLKYVEDEENRQKFLNIINEEAERLTRLINDILSLSNIEQNIECTRINFSGDRIIEDVYTLMKIEAEKKNMKLSVDLNNTLSLVGDPDKFKQMMINLIDNAVKYSEEGDSVLITSNNKKGIITYTVEDTGIGIPKKDVARVFERFYRVDKARSRAKGGTGLGLAIVKHIVKTFNGNIEVESQLGVGTKFIIKMKGIKE